MENKASAYNLLGGEAWPTSTETACSIWSRCAIQQTIHLSDTVW